MNELNNLLLEFPSDDFEFKEDYSIIKANYLIKSIDAAFEDWQQGVGQEALHSMNFVNICFLISA